MKNEKDEPLRLELWIVIFDPSVPLLLGAADRPELVGDNILAPVESYDIKFISMGLLIDEGVRSSGVGHDYENDPAICR